MICTACGTEAAADVVTCRSCGSDLQDLLRTGVSASASFPIPPASTAHSSATERLLKVGAKFGPRYRIVSLLGVGGMGAVYKADDLELNMAVALKVIRHHEGDTLATDFESELRFKRELVLARQITHKNVIRIHDLGEVDGTKYITMAYVTSDLACRLDLEGALPIDKALKFARQIAEGLGAAHEAGVVHRDLKPANILIEGDTALITDFGIARGADASADGGIVGTLQYMAPEQARGLPLDHRADLYAFGLIVYEMLVGRRLIGATTGRRRIFDQEVMPALTVDLNEVPGPTAAVIRKCLEDDPDERYQSAAELVAALSNLDDRGNLRPARIQIPASWPVIGGRSLSRSAAASMAAATMIAPLISVAALLRTPAAPSPAPDPVSVLIADFQNMSGEPALSGVVEQTLGAALEGASFVNLFQRDGRELRDLLQQLAPGQPLTTENARLIAQREGIKLILAGSIRRDGTQYRVDVQTIDPIPGTVLSTESGTAGSAADVLGAVMHVGSDVRTNLGDTTPESARLAGLETFTSTSIEAASVYWRAQELLNNAKYEESVPLFRRAIELDNSFARAHASLALSSFYLGRVEEAERLFKVAFSHIDRMNEREKFRTYGLYYLFVARDYQRAVDTYSKLVEAYPADRVGYGNLAVAHFYTLNFARAAEAGQRAVQLYPSSLKLRNNLALFSMYASDFEAARQQAEQVVKRDPKYYQAYLPLAIASLDQSHATVAKAYETMAATGRLGHSRGVAGLADLALYEGRYGDAETAVQPGIEADTKTANVRGLRNKQLILAEAYRGLGRSPDAVRAIQQAVDNAKDEAVLLPAGRLLLSLGREKDASVLATRLRTDVSQYGRVYAAVLEGELSLRRHAPADAVATLQAALKISDLWLPHFVLGIAYIEAERYPDALAEFELCQKRRGEATALFLDDVPTVRYLATLPYWLGRAQEGLGLATQASQSFARFLALRGTLGDDPLVQDARRRSIPTS
jgi:serine/threonine protein kinase/tetratricopeptide (TPR) repeat protein